MSILISQMREAITMGNQTLTETILNGQENNIKLIKASYDLSLSFVLGNAEIITEDLSVAQGFFYKFKSIF